MGFCGRLERMENPTTISSPPQKKKWKKRLKIAGGIVLILVVSLGVFFVSNRSDVPAESIQNENLQVSPFLIPNKENAFFKLRYLSRKVNEDLAQKETASGETFSEVLKAFDSTTPLSFEEQKILKAMESYFLLMDEVFAMQKYQNPNTASPQEMSSEGEMSEAFEQRAPFDVVRLQKMRVVSLIEQGKTVEAARILSDLFSFFRMTSEGNADLAEFMIFRVALVDILLKNISPILRSGDFSASALAKIQSAVSGPAGRKTALEKAIKIEYLWQDAMFLETLSSMRAENAYFSHPNRTRRYLADWFQYILDPRFVPRDRFVRNIARKGQKPNFLLKSFSPNGAGKVLAGVTMATYDSYFLRQFEVETKMRMFVVDLALQRYFREKKTLPETLERLSPEYLKVVPVDARGQRFEYLPEQGFLRSTVKTLGGEVLTWEIQRAQ